ncbi:MAG: metal ABC transporter ATP-binding protein [Anaerolineae bacterium]|nr:metal ABC transporter ATP-binding protein [Anaerolineae bacterium]
MVRGDRQEVIIVRHLWAGYENEQVLEDINLTVHKGDFIGLIGPNGGGKTTLLKVLLGLLPPSRGEIQVLGHPVREGRKHIGYVPQVVAFDREFPINVWDVARMGRLGKRRLLRRYTIEDDVIVAEALRQVDMFDLRDRPIGALSGGQRQRVYIARALVTRPEILLLDEPTSSVDPKVSTSIYELLRVLNETMTIVLISHDMSAISSYVKSVGCLNRRLFYHEEPQLTPEMLALAYQCPIDLIAHGVPHRVFADHHQN